MLTLPFCLIKGENPAFFLCRNALPLHIGNHTALTRKSRHSRFLDPFWTLISAFLGAAGKIVRTGQHHRPETLLAGMDTALAELVILASAVLAQEERPFQTPFLAPAHKSPSSGGFFCGAGLSGLFRSAHSRFASSSRSRIEGFFSGVVLRASA